MTEQATAAGEPLLRPLRQDDLDRVLQLELELFGSGAWTHGMFVEELRAPHRCYLAVEVDGELVGYAGANLGEESHVMTIGVAPHARRRGYASRQPRRVCPSRRAIVVSRDQDCNRTGSRSINGVRPARRWHTDAHVKGHVTAAAGKHGRNVRLRECGGMCAHRRRRAPGRVRYHP